MKFIHLTDTHVIGGGRKLFGADPARRLSLAVDSINAEHSDAAFVMLTGDMTHWGDLEAYRAFHAEIARLAVPLRLMVGNHDDTQAFAAQFPDTPRDPNGFVQYAFDTQYGRAICLDTKRPGSHAGQYCTTRRDWLASELTATEGPILLFMHHPPFPVGIAAMDAIMMLDTDPFYEVIAPHLSRIRHLFFGHLHRMVSGNWRGLSYSCMRGLNHQVALDLRAGPGAIPGSLEAPAYGVVLLDEDHVTVHMHEFASTAPKFPLHAPPDIEMKRYQLDMTHSGFDDL